MKQNTRGFRFCVYGGQFGSEGKGCVAEWLIRQYHVARQLVVIGENAPNSGHTSSKGKTRSLPVSAYDADVVLLGPDSAIDPHMLAEEIRAIRASGNSKLQVYVHEAASVITADDVLLEQRSGIVKAISSTASGGGASRTAKALHRQVGLIMRSMPVTPEYFVVDRVRWFELLAAYEEADWLFECSQGLMLDLNLGYYPYVTSRPTHPRAAIERNGVGPSSEWSFIGTFRTYPIRTGGPSGPTGGRELTWAEVGAPAEIATVTKRTRRVFEFSGADFLYSLRLVKPHAIAFTHLDYLPEAHREQWSFVEWLARKVGLPTTLASHPLVHDLLLITSEAPSMFQYHGPVFQQMDPKPAEPVNPFELTTSPTI